MGYACPVCDDPQADAGHLANHLAFTALARGGDHEAWLDEHVPGWGQLGESELADELVDEAEEAEYPQVFEESGVEGGHDHDQGTHGHGVDPADARARGRGEMDDEARAIMEEARAITEEMRADGDAGADSADESGENEADGDDA